MTKIKNRRERFLVVGERRCNQVIRALASLGMCSNRVHYDYDEEEIDEMFLAIGAAFEKLKA